MTKKVNIKSIPELVTNVALLNLTREIDVLKNKHRETCEKAVRSILHALDCKDHYTYGHSMRVAFYSLTLGHELGFDPDELYNLELTALFHDIGKIGVPDSVLLKPSKLTEEEMIQMQSHPVKSAEILRDFDEFKEIAHYAKHHHERFDGRGYPNGMSGEDIPVFSRIILIADTFDAMTSSRPYRNGLPYKVAYDELIKYSRLQFDPKMVNHFIKGMERDSRSRKDTFSLKIINGNFKKDAA